MNPATLAAALAEAQLSAAPAAMAAKMIRMNAEYTAAIAKVIDAAQQNLTNVDNVMAGLSQNLNISV